MGEERVPDINILLVGPTGAGKSTTGNALLGEEVFTIGDGFDSVTREINFGDFELPKTDGSGLTWRARVIDSPGFADTSLSAEEHQELFDPFADQASNGLQVLLFFANGRLDQQTQQIAQLISERMGDDIKRITILVVTHSGKNSQRRELALKESAAFQKWQDHFQGGLVCIENGEDEETRAPEVQQILYSRLAQLLASTGGFAWQNHVLQAAKEWQVNTRGCIAGLPPDLQPGPKSQLALLQRGQASRKQVTDSIAEQQAIQRHRQEMERQRREAELARAAEEQQRREQEAAAEAAQRRAADEARRQREAQAAAAAAQRRAAEEAQRQREAQAARDAAQRRAAEEQRRQREMQAAREAAQRRAASEERKRQEMQAAIDAARRQAEEAERRRQQEREDYERRRREKIEEEERKRWRQERQEEERRRNEECAIL